jgi:hypothetical protein
VNIDDNPGILAGHDYFASNAVKTLQWLFQRQKFILENLALRQQLAVLNRSAKRSQLTPSDRMFWVLLSRFGTCAWRSLNHAALGV